jgi:hypothetical protein
MDTLEEIQSFRINPTFLSPMFEKLSHCRADSNDTLFAEIQLTLTSLPTEIIQMIAMSSGFLAALNLKNTNQKFRKILSDRQSWREYNKRSPDIIQSKVTIDTKLHQFDQLVFAEWFLDGRIVPLFVHRPFLKDYEVSGSVSFICSDSGKTNVKFFDDRETLPCFLNDVHDRIESGELSEDVMESRESVNHSCAECKHYDNRTVLKSLFIHDSVNTYRTSSSLEYVYELNRKHQLLVCVQAIETVVGYKSEFPCVTSQISKLNGKPLRRGLLGFYIKYIAL